MIAIVSSVARERAALAYLCELRAWTAVECVSLRALKRLTSRASPRVVLVRYQLDDGYSDDVLATLGATGRLAEMKVIVLLPAGAASSIEARQLEIGADCVQRDPIRSEVLLVYLAKYLRVVPSNAGPRVPHTFSFAGAKLHVLDRTLHFSGRSLVLTPREAALVELLASHVGEVVTYEVLYNEVLGRRFDGDTSNMRVLLGKLGASLETLGLSLRDSIDVIPKTGYRPHAFSAASVDKVRPVPPRH